MDLSTITVADFKAQFRRDFAFLPEYDPSKLYNAGTRVYYATTELFYDCKVNGTIGIAPTVTANWDVVADDVDNYVQDSDIEAAFSEAQMTFNQSLFTTDATIKLGYLYLTAHYLVHDLRAAAGGLNAPVAMLTTGRSVGNVSENYGIPQAYLDDPMLTFYVGSAYGLKYLSFIWAQLRGGVYAVYGATQP